MRQLLCAFCVVAVVAIAALTGDATHASDSPAMTASPAASLAAPPAIDRWAFVSLAISAGALAIAASGAPRRERFMPAVAAAGEHAQRLLHRAGQAFATAAASGDERRPAPAAPAADTATLEGLMETIGARYLADLQSLHGAVEEVYAAQLATRDERIVELGRQIEILERERDVLAVRVHELEQVRADAATALQAARDDIERRLASVDQSTPAGREGKPPPPRGSSPGGGRPGAGARASRGQRSKGGR